MTLLAVSKIVLLVILIVSMSIICMRYFWGLYVLFNGEEYRETSQDAIRDIGAYLISHNLSKSLLYDFGSSRGNFIFGLLKICTKLKVVGVENDYIKIVYAKISNLFDKNRYCFSFLMKDFLTVDISKADVIFVYVPRILLPELEMKLQKELGKRAIVITYRISFPHWKPSEIIGTDILHGVSRNSIFVYRAPRK